MVNGMTFKALHNSTIVPHEVVDKDNEQEKPTTSEITI
jgi:hypothetical protein